MDIKSMPKMSAVNIAILLIGVGVFYNFVISPIYTKYQLNSCLQKVDTDYLRANEEYCEAVKPSNLNSCLHEAQSKIYCADPVNTIKEISSTGLLKNWTYCRQPVPDNSNGYWNENVEYQKLAKVCEEQVASRSCDFSKEEVDHSIGDVKAARDECFKLY